MKTLIQKFKHSNRKKACKDNNIHNQKTAHNQKQTYLVTYHRLRQEFFPQQLVDNSSSSHTINIKNEKTVKTYKTLLSYNHNRELYIPSTIKDKNIECGFNISRLRVPEQTNYSTKRKKKTDQENST